MIGNSVDIIYEYFPDLSVEQKRQFAHLKSLYVEWNEMINVISRKDIENLYVKHVLHSLSIGKYIEFKDNTYILDLGAGGGFPGIPLAILFPNCRFLLIDARAKKIKVVQAIATELGLKNLTARHGRAEELKEKFDFIVSRAVAPMKTIMDWTTNMIKQKHLNIFPNGYIFLKGGDLSKEIKAAKVGKVAEEIPVDGLIPLDEFDEKWLVYVPE